MLALAWIARACLALLFATALWHKARAPRDFAAAVAQYRLLPASLAWPAAACLLLAECAVLAGLLAWPLSPAPFAAGAAALLTLYALAIAINLGRGRDSIDCGCHGFTGRQRIAGWMVVRNLGLATGAALLALATAHIDALPLPDAATRLTIVGSTLVACLLYAAAHALLANAARLARR